MNVVGPLRHLHVPFYLVNSCSVSGQVVDDTMTLPTTVMEKALQTMSCVRAKSMLTQEGNQA